MADSIQHSISMGLAGCIAAIAILLWSMLSSYTAGHRSYIDSQRRLPMDSGPRMLATVGFVGSVMGVLFSFYWLDSSAILPIGILCCIAGVSVSLVWLRVLNHQYLSRANALIREGQAKQAFEDASEVDRSSRALRPQAQSIMKDARDMIYTHDSSAGVGQDQVSWSGHQSI